jgi:glycosyl transferase family 2
MKSEPAARRAVGTRVINTLLGASVAGAIYRSVRAVQRRRRVVEMVAVPRRSTVPAPVTVVVPARNEAAVLDSCLRGIREQTYGRVGGELRIVVVDDDSTDGTGEIAHRHAGEDPRLSVVRVDGPPPGWTGKVHAMHAGVGAAGAPRPGEWLLFVDADTVLGAEALERLLATAISVDADLVSTPGGPPPRPSLSWPLLVPPALQMIGENADPDGAGRKAFAIGHCILLRREQYEKMGGWEALSARRNEDIALATAVRDCGGTTRTVAGLDHVTTSGMDPFGQGWASFRKSFVAATKGSVPVLLGGGLGQVALSLAAPAAVVTGCVSRRRWLAALGSAGWVAQGVAHHQNADLMRSRPWLAPLAPLTGALFGGVLIDGSIRVLRGTAGWKGRADVRPSRRRIPPALRRRPPGSRGAMPPPPRSSRK